MLKYNVYRNDGSGGPVDFSTPHATGLTATAHTDVVPPGDWKYAIRPYDTVSGLENLDTASGRRVVVVGTADVSQRPAGPGLAGVVTAPGGLGTFSWAWRQVKGGVPTGFKVWLAAGASVSYGATPFATVPYRPGQPVVSCPLSGLAAGTWTAAVRAYNALGDDAATVTATTFIYWSPPAVAVGLSATATARR